MVPAKRVKPSDEETVETDLFEDPLGLIYAEHYRCRVVCNTLDEIVNRFPALPNAEELQSLLTFFETDLSHHVADEEQTLFPMLSARCEDTDNWDSIGSLLLEEHSADKQLVDQVLVGLRALAEGQPLINSEAFVAAARAMSESQRRHLAWENSVVLPLARKRLTGADLVDLGRAMAERRGQSL